MEVLCRQLFKERVSLESSAVKFLEKDCSSLRTGEARNAGQAFYNCANFSNAAAFAMTAVTSFTVNEIDKLLRERGANEKHLSLFWRMLLRGEKPASSRKLQFPKAVAEEIEKIWHRIESACQVVKEADGGEGSKKIVLKMEDGELVEAVLLPREGLCVSTQVGCAVRCKFCMTGKCGLLRQLSDMEILLQLIRARQLREVDKVVFMGMGEPSHNRKNVLSALDMMARFAGIGFKDLVLSTVGDRRLFAELLARPIKPALALSLHSVIDEKRLSLLPKAEKIPVKEILEFTEQYAKAGSYPIQFQWTLIKDLNDGEDEIEELKKLWPGQFGVLNMIPVNKVEGSPFERPSEERLDAIRRELAEAKILVKYRDSAAQDVEGGCGQLRARVIKNPG